MFDFRYNYWGTTNPAVIETKITHRADDSGLPLVRYSRCLHDSPLSAMIQAWLGDDEVQPCWFRGNATLQAGVNATIPIITFSGFDAAACSFSLTYPSNRLAGFGLANLPAQTAWTSVESNSPTSLTVRMAVTNQPIRGLGELCGLVVLAASNPATAFAPLSMPSVTATNASGSFSTNGPGEGLQLLFLGREPLVDAWLDTNRQRTLTLYGNPGSNYTIQSATNLPAGGTWQTVTQHWRLTNQCQQLSPPTNSAQAIFYRAFRE